LRRTRRRNSRKSEAKSRKCKRSRVGTLSQANKTWINVVVDSNAAYGNELEKETNASADCLSFSKYHALSLSVAGHCEHSLSPVREAARYES
jgi:hypothetical protein